MSNYNHYFLNTERHIDIQIKQGNKIFSCHPNLEFLPLQHIPPVFILKTKQTPTKPKKVVYKRMKYYVFLFFLLCISFLLVSFLFLFHFSPYLHKPPAFNLLFMTIERRTNEPEKKICRNNKETHPSLQISDGIKRILLQI